MFKQILVYIKLILIFSFSFSLAKEDQKVAAGIEDLHITRKPCSDPCRDGLTSPCKGSIPLPLRGICCRIFSTISPGPYLGNQHLCCCFV